MEPSDKTYEEGLKVLLSRALNAPKHLSNPANARKEDLAELMRTYSGGQDDTELSVLLEDDPVVSLPDEEEADKAPSSPMEPLLSDLMGMSLMAGTLYEVVERPKATPQDILIMTIGSRGDIQPFVALAIGLQKHGHRVRLAGFECFRSFVESNKIEFFPLAGDPKALMKLCVDHGMFSVSFLYEGLVNFRAFFVELLDSCWKACIAPRDGKPYCPTAIISNPPVMAHYHLAEALGIPLYIAFTMPWSKTTAFPQPMLADRGWGSPIYNAWSFSLMEKTTWFGMQDIINRWRVKSLGLAPIKSLREGAHALRVRQTPHIYCYSEKLCPRPADWSEWLCVTNFWFLDEGASTAYVPPPELAAFLAAGPKPIYIGFGSIPTPDPDGLTRLILNAGRRARKRLVIAKGWGGVTDACISEDMRDRVFFLESCPHDWLFPQMDAVVHHGGAGTLAAGLRAGKPTAVVAFFGDQFFWGSITQRAGLGVWTQSSSLTEDWLTDALEKISCPDLKAKAEEIAVSINGVDGVEQAVRFFNSRLPFPSDPVQSSVAYEHESYSLLRGWTTSKPQFTDILGNPLAGTPSPFLMQGSKGQTPIPLRHGYEWSTPWMIAHPEEVKGVKQDANGWVYSSNPKDGFHTVMTSADYYRRRKWERKFVRSITTCNCPACSPE